MTDEQKIREACIKANSEIAEWKDGTLVQFEWYGSHTGEGGDDVFSAEPNEFEQGIILGDEVLGASMGGNGQVCVYDLTKKDFKNGVYEEGTGDVYEYIRAKIIGRIRRLEDVLLAMEREKLFEKVYPTRIIQAGYKATNLEMIYELWNLKDDNLENQSEELKKFVADLL